MNFIKTLFISASAILCLTGDICAQTPSERDYWIDKYLSVSYPLRNIKVTSGFGSRRDPFTGKAAQHSGLDMKADYEAALSMFDGVVKKIGKDGRAGIFVTMNYGSYEVSYCHLSKISVLEGDTILAGEQIGITGNTGRSTGPHLHITSKKDGCYVNPYDLLLYIREVRKEVCEVLGVSPVNMGYGGDPQVFFSDYAPLAMEQQRKYGIPASVTLAQMAYESAWGQSELARNGNNFFGIKASRAWIEQGKPYSLHDDDRSNEAFCNYRNAAESVEHHSRLLMSDRYSRCRKYSETDYHHWLVGIKAAGYATARNYVHSCEKLIKAYKLYLYDRLAA